MRYVVGSGPAGVSCATALLRLGHRVTMLDAGIALEADRRSVVSTLAAQSSESWDRAQVQLLRDGFSVTQGQVPDKRAYGSDFAFRDADCVLPMTTSGTDVRPSLALGGLSNVWGGAILPYRAADLHGWPISLADLAPHYRAAAEWMPISAPPSSDLDAAYPLDGPRGEPLRPSRQAEAFLGDLQAHREALAADGYLAGPARLAVRAGRSAHDTGCVYCGLCLYGCPYGLIYNAADTLTSLRSHANFSYVDDVVVRRVRESGDGVFIDAESLHGSGPRTFAGARVYLACGVLSSTRIVLESMEAFDETVTLQDSQYFLLPLLRLRQTDNVQTERLHTLAQVFIEIDNPRVSRYNVHLQVYSYNDLYEQAAGAGWLPRSLRDQAIGRLLVIQGYLHSAESTPIALRLERPGAKGPGRLRLEAEPRVDTTHTVGRVATSLARHWRPLGAVPLKPWLQVCAAGRGYHCGGTLPMHKSPGRFESDTLGRPHGFTRTHVVDASTFSTIPAGPITLTVVANAHRIGSADVP